MQLLFELLMIKNKEKGTLMYFILKCSIAAAISLTVLSMANIVGIKWLAILAVIDLVYYVCWKLSGCILLFAVDIWMVGIKGTIKYFFKEQYSIKETINDIETILK